MLFQQLVSMPLFSFSISYPFFIVCILIPVSSLQITQDLSRMKRFNAQEALDYGLIDRIVRPPRIKADAPRKDSGTGLG